jgi:hypothetical protein
MSLRNVTPAERNGANIGLNVIHQQVDAIPSTRARLMAIRHWSAGRACSTAGEQPELATHDVGERGG